MKSLIDIKNLTFAYDKTNILEDINLNINNSKIIAIVGKNGGGKSTLVKIILKYGDNYRYKGTIDYHINESDMTYLPQIAEFYKNFPITVYDIVISGLTNKKNIFRKFTKQEKEKAVEYLKKFNIYEKRNEQIKNISGGQLQRALLARAFISNKKLIFLDEPETYLDYNFFGELISNFSRENRTLVIITHELGKIKKYVDEIYIVEKYLRKEEIGDSK